MSDLANLRTYHGDDIGSVITTRIVLAADWLLERPFIEREVGTQDWRKWKPRQTAYVLIYRPVDDDLEISRVRHGREDWMADL